MIEDVIIMLYTKKTPLKKKISHIFEYLGTMILGGIINCFPYPSLDRVAHVLVKMFLPLFPRAKIRVRDNIIHRYPEKAEKEIEEFIFNNLRNTLRVTLEVFQSWKFQSKKFALKYLISEDEKSVTLFSQREKGIVAIEGHFGNWELPIFFYYHHGVDISFVAKHLSNPFVDQRLEKRRKKYGGKILYMNQTLKLMRVLRKGKIIGLVADQDAGGKGVFVDFLGRKASTFTGPAYLSLLSGCDIILSTVIFQGRGRYKFKLIHVHRAKAKKKSIISEREVQKLTQKWSSALEKEVEKNPQQYFWIHRRWKTQPPGGGFK